MNHKIITLLFILVFPMIMFSSDIAEYVGAIRPSFLNLSDLPDAPDFSIKRNTTNVIISPGVIAQYSIPDQICAGSDFIIQASITNNNLVPTPYTISVWEGLIPSGVTFISAVVSAGSFDSTMGTGAPCPAPGVGRWSIGAAIPATSAVSIIITCNAGVVGPITVSSRIDTTIPSSVCIFNTATVNPTPLASNFNAMTNNVTPITGFLSVAGGTPPYFFVISVFPPASQGTLQLIDPTTGEIKFTPALTFTTAIFQFFVIDANGCVSNTATGTITSLPIANSQTFISCSPIGFTGTLSPLIVGGFPPYTYSLVGVPVGGTVVINAATGEFTFTRTIGSTGDGSFTYQVTDSMANTANGTVTIDFIDSINPYVVTYQTVYDTAPCT